MRRHKPYSFKSGYFSNLTKQLGSDHDYTLDELIELGHQTLAEAGRE